MKTMSAMEVRKHFGAVMDEVRLKSETIVLERAGKPIAMIEPIRGESVKGESVRKRERLDALDRLRGLAVDAPRSNDLDQWLERERNDWSERP
jgi:antitoxin (DNA-binding transcriptional repressor) of toxin-antitoxin stability system